MPCSPDFSKEAMEAAARRLSGVARRTPLFNDPKLDALVGRPVYLKCETLQYGGAFKFRGAYNRLSQLDSEERGRGVVAWSSGNHAVAVAMAARKLSIAARIVVPNDGPRAKLERAADLGAKLTYYDRLKDDREEIARAICARSGATLVPSYNDPHIIAGQSTVACEMIEQSGGDNQLRAIAVPCGGGGLAAGTALSLRYSTTRARLHIVEPVGFGATGLSIAAGHPERIDPAAASTICDALALPGPGDLTFPLIRDAEPHCHHCSDDQVAGAIRFAFAQLKLVLEPSGAIALAALLAGKMDEVDGAIGVVLSGAGVDSDRYAEWIRS